MYLIMSLQCAQQVTGNAASILGLLHTPVKKGGMFEQSSVKLYW